MASLKERFEEIIHMTWSEFVELERGETGTVDDTTMCALVRACGDTRNTNAIKLAFDRTEGLLETPIEVKVPKFYVRYINAKKIDNNATATEAIEPTKNDEAGKYDPATAKLRETLSEMRKMPKQVIGLVLGHKEAIEQGKQPPHDPMVKSVIVANLLYNAARGHGKAIDFIFDQIDGKLARTITLLGGNDVYIDDYSSTIAPPDSVKDKEGYYISESEAMTTAWLRGFANSQKGLDMLVEELDDERE